MKMADTLDGMQKKNIRKVAEAHVRALFSRGKVNRSEKDWGECRGRIRGEVRYPEETLWLSEPSERSKTTPSISMVPVAITTVKEFDMNFAENLFTT
ncbi:hypothetical protein RUM43_002463 [Polyplax serrata]|uniref:Uncharacterized protein n=1 Tax=Polyplax serrata TaxID=468196 RepID=A0AAN8PCS0_POLSC